MKVALVHDYLKEYGGAERVLSALCEIFPEAPVYTIFCKKGSGAEREIKSVRGIGEVRIIKSWFGKIPFCDKLISPFRFLIPAVWKSFDFSGYDLVISSASWAVTKGFALRQAQGKVVEVCYCHTPPRYLYGYETSRNWKKNPFIRFYALIVNHFMRMYDFEQAQKVTYFIANSREVQQRISKFYRRESVVINPPVDIPLIANGLRTTADSKPQIRSGRQSAVSNKQYFLTGGRLEAAKNFDLIINACNEIKTPLKIYGGGTREQYLKSISGPTIEFLGKISDEEKFKLMAESKAFIVAATDEDFGITPVEAMACGTPVIAYKGGGYLETVIEGKTGVFFDLPSHEASARQGEAMVDSLVGVLKGFEGSEERKIKEEDCRKQAEKFSKTIFKKNIKEFLDSHGFITDLH